MRVTGTEMAEAKSQGSAARLDEAQLPKEVRNSSMTGEKLLREYEHQVRNTAPLLQQLRLLPGTKALEFGSAFGASAFMLAKMGFVVTGVDVNPKRVCVAQANAQTLFPELPVNFLPISNGLPFADQSFDFVSANSVLEYVEAPKLMAVCHDLDRVLKPGGVLFIGGTSNRLMPREAHSYRWFVNYLPTDRWQQGLWPWRLRMAFPGYRDLIAESKGQLFLEAKRIAGRRLLIYRGVNLVARCLGTSIGALMPSICYLLQKGQQ